MVDSAREAALKALKAALNGIAWIGAPPPEVRRNAPEETAVPPGGLIALRDGDPGEPEVYLSPPAYAYRHRAEIAVFVQHRDAAIRDALCDAILRDIGAALDPETGDPTLGGAVEMATPVAPEPLAEPVEGAATIKAALVPVILEYTAPSPLG